METLTAEPLVETVFFAWQLAAVEVAGFPPVVVIEGAESPAAVVEVEFPVPAAALCEITTQLPKPAPEMNCYESRSIGKQTTTCMSVENLLQDTDYRILQCNLYQEGVEL